MEGGEGEHAAKDERKAQLALGNGAEEGGRRGGKARVAVARRGGWENDRGGDSRGKASLAIGEFREKRGLKVGTSGKAGSSSSRRKMKM